MASTENITVLFTDLVGSTELSSSLTPEAANQIRRDHFAALRQAVADTGGTEVKNLGDGLMVAFDATAPALFCAVEMQQAIERHNPNASVPLAIRIGISTGDVTAEDGDYFGDPVIEASRLCAVAQGGQILTTDIVKGLARRSGHTFVTERELDLKGLPEPVVAWEAVWERAEEGEGSGIPLPPRLPPTPSTGLVGRASEKDQLHEVFKTIVADELLRTVLVAGEAGVGKSTLTATLARQAHVGGALVLYGRCDEDLPIPYGPFVELLGHYLTHVDDGALSVIGDDCLALLAHLAPRLRDRRPDLAEPGASDPDAERWILYGAVTTLLERAAADQAVVVVVDDLHWADPPTLQLLRHLTSHVRGRVLLIGTYRDVELSASHPLTETLAALTREARVTRVALSGLADDEVISLMEAAAGHDMDEAGVQLGHALYRETDGNPFFVAEVLRHLIETRAIVQDDTGRWVPTQELADAGLPDSVRQVVGSRIARLGEGTERVLAAASVLGQEFDVDLLVALTQTDEDTVLDVLEAASAAALVSEVRSLPGRFRFAHALIQHTVYEDLRTTRRARLHRVAAEALEARLGENAGSRAGELARHWLAATRPTEASKAVSYARLAGESALGALAPTEAIRWFNEALSVLAQVPDPEERATCLAGLGEAQRQAGEPAYRETLLEAARLAAAVGDGAALVRAALANNRGFVSAIGEVDGERVAVLEDALEAVGTGNSAERARLLALLASERLFDSDYPTRRALADEALSMARDVGDPHTILDTLLRRGLPIWIPETIEELLSDYVEAEALADEVGDPVGKVWALGFRAMFSVQVGDVGEVNRCHDEAGRLAAEIGQPMLKWSVSFSRSWSMLLAGDIGGSEACADEALRMGNETGQPDVLVFYSAHLFAIRWQQGRLGEVADFIVEMEVETPGLPLYRALAAFALVESGRDEEARAKLLSEASSGFSAPRDYALLSYLNQWARVASRLTETEAAEMLYDRLADWGHLTVTTGAMVLGVVAHDLGMLATVLGRYDVADTHFAHAFEISRRLEAPFFVALTQLEWSRALLARGATGDAGRAETMLAVARDVAERYGFPAVARQAADQLATLG